MIVIDLQASQAPRVRQCRFARLLAVALAAVLLSQRVPADVLPEIEPNNSKSAATPLILRCGDSLTGTTTGSSTSSGLGSADFFHITLAGETPGALIRRRLTREPGPAVIGGLRGLTQTALGINPTSDGLVQSVYTEVPGFVQWYGFGRGTPEVYFRVTGTSSTNAAYQWTLSCQSVTPLVGPTDLLTGPITIANAGHTTDTDMWVYDGQWNAIAGFGNDGSNSLTRTFTPGSYFLAISNYNLANNLASPADDTLRTGNVFDFHGVIANSSQVSGQNLSVGFTDTDGTSAVVAAKDGPFDIVFISFAVIDPVGACCLSLSATCSALSLQSCQAAGGIFMGVGSSCITNPCVRRCCLTGGYCITAPAAQCSALGGVPGAIGAACSYVGAVATYRNAPALVIADNSTISDAQIVSEHYAIADIDVAIRLQHTYVGDLRIDLTHGAETVRLWSRDCASSDNFDAIADDEAGALQCASPIAGRYDPGSATAGESLSVFDGTDAAGVWTLTVTDAFVGNTGLLEEWSLIITPNVCANSSRACCFANGACTLVAPEDCAAAGGAAQGASSNCAPNLCPQPGACCLAGGTCAMLLSGPCASAGGAFSGAPSCTPDPCPQPRACCNSDTSCTFLLPAECAAAGGVAMPDGSACASVACPDLNPGQNCNNPIVISLSAGATVELAASTCGKRHEYSAACLSPYDRGEDVIYRLDVAAPLCARIAVSGDVANGSIWLGFALFDACPAAAAPPNCVALAASAAVVDATDVLLDHGSYFLMIDTFPAPTCAAYTLQIADCPRIACCISGVCQEIGTPVCAAAGGQAQGFGSTCADVGCPRACCDALGVCSMLRAVDCAAVGGATQPEGASCATMQCPAPGACCDLFGGCQALSAAACEAIGGRYRDGLPCGPYYTVGSVSWNYEEIAASPTAEEIDFGDDRDDGQAYVALPFVFHYYNNYYTYLLVSTNGYATFDNVGDARTNDAIPSETPPNNALYPLWDDLDLHQNGRVLFDTRGDSGSRVFIVEWNNVGQYNFGAPPSDAAAFQLKLSESDGAIEFHYHAITREGVPPSTGAGDYTVGVENADGHVATTMPGAALGGGFVAFRFDYHEPICELAIACCFGASCSAVTPALCAAFGGVALAGASTCEPNPCPPADPCSSMLVGDANCDGVVNNFDIDAFVSGALFPTAAPPDVPPAAPNSYYFAGGSDWCWEHRRCWGDVNCDGYSNNFDIDPFVACILNTPPVGAPCQLPAVCLASACCYSSGACQSISAAACVLTGGAPRAMGEPCNNGLCP